MAHQLNEAELLGLGMSRVNIATLREIARVAGVGGTVSTTFTIADVEMLVLGIRDMAAPMRRIEQAAEALEMVALGRRADLDVIRKKLDALEQTQTQRTNLDGIHKRLDALESVQAQKTNLTSILQRLDALEQLTG